MEDHRLLDNEQKDEFLLLSSEPNLESEITVGEYPSFMWNQYWIVDLIGTECTSQRILPSSNE